MQKPLTFYMAWKSLNLLSKSQKPLTLSSLEPPCLAAFPTALPSLRTTPPIPLHMNQRREGKYAKKNENVKINRENVTGGKGSLQVPPWPGTAEGVARTASSPALQTTAPQLEENASMRKINLFSPPIMIDVPRSNAGAHGVTRQKGQGAMLRTFKSQPTQL